MSCVNGDPATAELLFRIIISVNQLSIHGAVSDWCEEFAQQISQHFLLVQGNLLRHCMINRNPVAPNVFVNLDGFFLSIGQSRESWCVNTTKVSNIFQRTFG